MLCLTVPKSKAGPSLCEQVIADMSAVDDYQIQTSDIYRTVPTSLCKSGSLMISVGGLGPIVVSDQQVSEPSPLHTLSDSSVIVSLFVSLSLYLL